MTTKVFEAKLQKKGVDIVRIVKDGVDVKSAYGYVDGIFYKWDQNGTCSRAYPRALNPQLDIKL
jgi:hypothetical protein